MKATGVAIALALVASAPTASLAGGDAALGATVFRKCSACHDGVGTINRVGPHLVGVVGRPAASVEGFRYSQSMRDAAGAGLVWDETNLAEYLRSPRTKIPGNAMAFAGLKKDDDIANVIAWLKADPKPE